MAHGERHTAIAKQIQERTENCLKTLHSDSAASCRGGELMAVDLQSELLGVLLDGGKGTDLLQPCKSLCFNASVMPRLLLHKVFRITLWHKEILFPGLGCGWEGAAQEEAGAVSDGEEVVSACGQPSCRFYTCTAQEKRPYVRRSLKIPLISMHFNGSLTPHHMPVLLTWPRGDLWPDAGHGAMANARQRRQVALG